MLDTVKINHVQHISFTQSRLTDAVSVILSELLSYEHPSKVRCGLLLDLYYRKDTRYKRERQGKRKSRVLDANCVQAQPGGSGGIRTHETLPST